MKVLLTADLHLHNHKAFATYGEDGISSRLRDGLSVLKEITQQAKECDAVVIAGDIFHVSPPPPVVFNLVYDAFAELANSVMTILVVAGNHDLPCKNFRDERDIPFLKFQEGLNNGCDTTKFHVLNSLSKPVKIWGRDPPYEELFVQGCSHAVEEGVSKALLTRSPADLTILHQEVQGASVGKYVFESGVDPKMFTDPREWIVIGHIHRPQRISDRVLIPGAPLHIDFGDSGDRGFWILDTGKETLEMVKTTFPRFVTVCNPGDVKSDGSFYRVSTDSEKKEALSLPSVEFSIEEYVKQQRAPQKVLEAGRQLSQSVSSERNVPSKFVVDYVSLENFTVFEKASFTVGEGLCLVVGENGEREDRSNGAGKSSLFEAISWCLYGVTSKGERGAALLRRGSPKGSKCVVEVTLRRTSADRLKVTRTQTSTSSSLRVEGCGRILDGDMRVTQKELIGMLGVDSEFFNQMVYYSQEGVEFFSSLGDAAKKDLLGNLLGIQWYQDALEVAKKKCAAVTEMLRECEIERKSSQAKVDSLKRSIEDTRESERRWIQSHQEKTASLMRNKERIQKDLESAALEIEDAQKRIIECKCVEDSDLVVVDRNISEAQSRLKTTQMDCSKIQQELTKCEVLIAQIDKRGKSIEKLELGVRCSVCGSLVTEESRVACLRELGEERGKLEERLLGLKAGASSYERGRCALEEYLEAGRSSFRDLQNRRMTYVVLVSESRRLKERLDHLKDQISQLDQEIADVEKETCSFSGLSQLESRLEEAEECYRKSLSNESGLVEKFSIFEFWERGFGREGIPAMVLDEFCKVFTVTANEVLASVGSGMSVELTAHKKLKSGEVREKLDLVIKTSSGESSYALLSGGEKTRVDLVSMLTLNRLASQQYAIKNGLFGLLILDEVFSYLDGEGVELVYDLLRQFRARSIFVISHDSGLKALFDRVLRVRRVENTSIVIQG